MNDINSAKINLISYYRKELEKDVPKNFFERKPRRLVWFFIHYAIILTSAFMVVYYDHLWINIFLSIVIGNSLGTMGFLGHEILHGTVIKNRKLILFMGGACLLHWGLPPQVWINWHNGQHHIHTNKWFEDPDCFGPIEMHRMSKLIRFMEKLTPGSKTMRSYFFLLYWFTFHTAFQIHKNPRAVKNERNRKFSIAYFWAIHSIWILLTIYYGVFLYLMFIPFIVSNLVMMSYVVTNHFISPATNEVNDPLINTLTVRSPRIIEALHLQNNFHVEHHIFPNMNPSHSGKLAKIIKMKWPEKYQEMNHVKAICKIYKTPRLYESNTVLKNPRTGEESDTLLHHYLDF